MSRDLDCNPTKLACAHGTRQFQGTFRLFNFFTGNHTINQGKMGVCSSKSTAVTVVRSVSVRKQSCGEEISLVVNSKRTAVPRLQSVHSNPLHVRRKAKFQSPLNALRSSSGMETYSASGPLEYQGDLEASAPALAE